MKQIIRTTVFGLATGLGLSTTSVAQAQDPVPTPPRPDLPQEEPVEQAGVGSRYAYSRAGVIESGGSLGLSLANEYLAFTADPMIGYFLWDNIQGSAILGVQYVNVGGVSQTRVSLVFEPSFHYPFTDTFFGFIGAGIGAAMVDPALTTPEGDKVGFGTALAPRFGVQTLVGRSGLLNLGARQVLTFVDVDTDVSSYGGQTVLAFSNVFQLQAGYTIMF